MLDFDNNISPVYNLNESYNESFDEDGGIQIYPTESGDEEGKKIDFNKFEEELKILCFTWNLETIKEKGFENPKFVVYIDLTISIVVAVLVAFVFGYGTNWNILIFYPVLISAIMNFARVLYVLGQTHQQTKIFVKKKLFIIYQTVVGILGFGGIILAFVIKTPFGNETYFLIVLYPLIFLTSLVYSTTHEEQATPPWLAHRTSSIHPVQKSELAQKGFPKPKKINQKQKQFELYKKLFWASLTLSTMFIDVFSDVYYGVDLIKFYGKNSTFLIIIGVILIFCCLWDIILVYILSIFPGWVSYSAHLIALIMEIPNVVLTVISLWKIHELRFIVQKESLLRSLAIFSIIATALNALLHVVFIFDNWAVQNAMPNSFEFRQYQKSYFMLVILFIILNENFFAFLLVISTCDWYLIRNLTNFFSLVLYGFVNDYRQILYR